MCKYRVKTFQTRKVISRKHQFLMLSEHVNILHLAKHLNAHNCNGYLSPESSVDSGTDMSADMPVQT